LGQRVLGSVDSAAAAAAAADDDDDDDVADEIEIALAVASVCLL